MMTSSGMAMLLRGVLMLSGREPSPAVTAVRLQHGGGDGQVPFRERKGVGEQAHVRKAGCGLVGNRQVGRQCQFHGILTWDWPSALLKYVSVQ